MNYDRKELVDWVRGVYQNLDDADKQDALRFFPELRESEDERIRKWLVDYFGSIKETVWIHRDITCEQIIGWLEKQKEQKPVDYDHEMWKNCEANFEGGKKEVIDHPEKYGLRKEQKPAEKYPMTTKLKEHLANTPKEQLDVEWKELEKWNHVGPTVEEYFHGIKPVEWSEEDEEVMEDLYNFVISDFIQDHIHETRWKPWKTTLERNRQNRLKSLRPSWKPSEEQLKVFQNTMQRLLKAGGTGKWYAILESLYEQLKKL